MSIKAQIIEDIASSVQTVDIRFCHVSTGAYSTGLLSVIVYKCLEWMCVEHTTNSGTQ